MPTVVIKPPKPVETLERISMEAYLQLLQDACAGYIRLMCLDSPTLRAVRDNFIHVIKAQLKDNLSGTMSTSLRQDMISEVLSGRFPSKRYHNQYEPLNQGDPYYDEDFDTEADKMAMEDIRLHGQKCSSVCCTGAFICETMLAVLMNEDIREIKFERPANALIWHNNKPLSKYVALQVPAILAHYSQALEMTEEVKTPRLERFYINNVGIASRTYAMKNCHFDVLTMFDETTHYLEIPGALSEAAAADGYQYGGFSEHLMMAVTDVFSNGDRFPKMTELFLGSEACNTLFKMNNKRNHCISVELFRGIGHACPNLKVLDVSTCITVSADCLLFLFFHHTYNLLHEYVFMPDIRVDAFDRVVQNTICTVDEVTGPHDLEKYCAYCMDEWCSNGVRDGASADIRTPVIDDRLYDAIMEKYGHMARLYLVNVIKASDLVKAGTQGVIYELVRPPGPKPWEDGFQAPGDPTAVDYEGPWYKPDKIHYTVDEMMPVMNNMCKSLQCLKLNIDSFHPKPEIVPFLLRILPKLKSLGHTNIIRALKMIQKIPALNGISAANLEELEYTHGGHDCHKSDLSWVPDDIYEFVDDYTNQLNTFNYNFSMAEDHRAELSSDVALIASQCPNIKNMRICLFGEFLYIREDDMDIWEPFKRELVKLTSLSIFGHLWSEVVALLTSLGPRITKLYLALSSRAMTPPPPPQLELIFNICPNVEVATLSFGTRTIHVAEDRFLHDPPVPFPTLTNLTAHAYITKKAFSYLWARCVNLEFLNISYFIVMHEGFPLHEAQAEYSVGDVTQLFRTNGMKKLKTFSVGMVLKNIDAAKMLIESLPLDTKEISKLSIKVGLPQDHYANQEQMLVGLAQVMQNMRNFKLYCAEKSRAGRKITWTWSRTGILESLGNLGPLDGLVEPGDEQ